MTDSKDNTMHSAAPRFVPNGYRQGFVTGSTVFLSFSLAFLRYWAIESQEPWNAGGVATATIFAAGIIVQLYALFRALDVRDEEVARYVTTVRCFFSGVAIMVIGLFASILVAAG
jgi:hypothetical protein